MKFTIVIYVQYVGTYEYGADNFVTARILFNLLRETDGVVWCEIWEGAKLHASNNPQARKSK